MSGYRIFPRDAYCKPHGALTPCVRCWQDKAGVYEQRIRGAEAENARLNEALDAALKDVATLKTRVSELEERIELCIMDGN